MQYLTVRDVAEYLKLPQETVYKYARSGRIPAAKLGRHWRFDRGQVDRWVSRNTVGGGSRAPVQSGVPEHGQVVHGNGRRGVSVLVVDDELAVAKLLQRWLSAEDHEVRIARDGLEALELIDQGFDPDLIFLDLCMPRLDGAGFLRRLAGSGRRWPNVVLMTGRPDSSVLDEALEFDVRYSLEKPFAHAAVRRIVESVSDRRVAV